MSTVKKLLPEYNTLLKKAGRSPVKNFGGDADELQERIDALREKPKAKKSINLKELDSRKKAPAAKPETDDNMISVVDVATEMNMDPKVARAKLRRAGEKANEGRWPSFKRDSAEHKRFIKMLEPNTKKALARKAESK